MHDSSPPPFIVIRTPASTPNIELYDRALELAGVVHRIVDKASARFYLRDRLDRAATGLVFELARAARELASLRWRNFRAAHSHAADCATMLDILAHQESAPAAELERARSLVRELIADIATRSSGKM